MQIKTAGELRSFLAEVLIGIRDGSVNPTQAQAISKVAAQINQSLSVEVNTALQLERMGKDHPVAGTMQLGAPEPDRPQVEFTERVGEDSLLRAADEKVFGEAEDTLVEEPVVLPFAKAQDKFRTDLIWCDQCDARVAPEDATACRSTRCSLRKIV
jgi:ribosomal protein L40E